MTTIENSLADDLVTANKILDRAELAIPFGHVSVRQPTGFLSLAPSRREWSQTAIF